MRKFADVSIQNTTLGRFFMKIEYVGEQEGKSSALNNYEFRNKLFNTHAVRQNQAGKIKLKVSKIALE